MRAIVIKGPGGPEQLAIEERPDPVAASGHVLIAVKAFGLNHAEIYFREGRWAPANEITGIECVGLVRADASGRFRPGQTVMALVGGMGRSIAGSYAELTAVPVSNVVAVETRLRWEELAALPESYATGWVALMDNLALAKGQTIVIRGATSALGRAAVEIARHAGAGVVATTRSEERAAQLRMRGVEAAIERPQLSGAIRELHPDGVDGVLDLIGNTTILDSLAMLKRGGRACLAGFLGGGGPLELEPVFQIPSGRALSVLASALVFGGADCPLSGIPFQAIVERAEAGAYSARPARVFAFDQIRDAHRLMESGAAGGKIVVRV
jgi:NADPH:quinone reductase-like Zn-dependent oxidoreductase